jgi:transposase
LAIEGRPVSQRYSTNLRELVCLAAGGMAKTHIARQLKVGEASVYRILAASK